MKRTIFATLGALTLMAAASFGQDGQVYDKAQSNQQKRIQNGVATGKLSNHQAKRLEKNQSKINNEVANDRAKNGGTVTPGEKAKVAGQLHRESKDIAHKKQVDPKGPAVQ